jgi:serine/threonine-protein kinase
LVAGTAYAPNQIPDVLAPTGAPGAVASDALAELLGSTPPRPSLSTAAGKKANDAVATQSPSRSAAVTKDPLLHAATATAANAGDSARSRKSSVLPIAIIGVALLAVIGSGAYLFLGNQNAGSDKAGPTVVAATGPTSEAKTTAAIPTAIPPPATPVETPSTSIPNADPQRPVEVPTNPGNANARPEDAASKIDTPPIVALGKVDLRIKPWGTISVNGVAKGASPPTMQLQLAPGTYTIEIQNPAGATVSKTVEVVAGKPVTVRHSF